LIDRFPLRFERFEGAGHAYLSHERSLLPPPPLEWE
jgi:hypothetical protein